MARHRNLRNIDPGGCQGRVEFFPQDLVFQDADAKLRAVGVMSWEQVDFIGFAVGELDAKSADRRAGMIAPEAALVQNSQYVGAALFAYNRDFQQLDGRR